MSKTILPKTTTDAFLGGKVSLTQPESGYRAGSDAVLLASAIHLKAPWTVLDVGCGVGAVGVCLAPRFPNLHLTGIDLQADITALAKENYQKNGITGDVITGDILTSQPALKGRQFSCVCTNPPFYDETPARLHPGAAMACQQTFDLKDWLSFCLRHLAPKGTFYMIHRPQVLPDVLAFLAPRLGDIQIWPICTKADKPATRFILGGTLGVRNPLTLHPAVILHTAAGERTPLAERLMRHGGALYDL